MAPGLRDFTLEQDGAVLAALLSEASETTVTVDDVHAWFDLAEDESIFRAVMTTDGTGYADILHRPWHEAGQFTGRVLVAGPDRHRGLGTSLLEAITDLAVAAGAESLRCVVREQSADGFQFAERHGYSVRHHTVESTLDPTRIDRDILISPAAAGIIVASLAELGDTEAHRHAFWELYERLAMDMPGQRSRRPYAAFAQQFFDAPWFRAESQFVAMAGDEWVGVGALAYHPPTNSLYHQFTGVAREFRGRHIASALKRAMIAYALEIGADHLRSNTDSTNAPMIAILRAYGYVTRPGYFDMIRKL